jgi:spore coat polysaccharide biosynthesis predicted glycosyltransferase SpsG
MAGLMMSADLAVGAGGGSAWERCCLALPTLLIVTADNQNLQANAIASAGGAFLLGWYEKVTADKIAAAINRLAGDTRGRSAMAEAAAQLCDGEGAKRVVEAIDEAVKRSPVRPRA